MTLPQLHLLCRVSVCVCVCVCVCVYELQTLDRPDVQVLSGEEEAFRHRE